MLVHRRNYGCRVSDDYTYKGLRTLILENAPLRVTVLVDKGTDIMEFLYKPHDIDFMWASNRAIPDPGFVQSSPPANGNFMDYYEGAWQEIFPNGGDACEYQGASIGQHGEVALLPWRYQIEEDQPDRVSVKMWVRTYRTPFYLEKTLTLEGEQPCLKIHERLVNEGAERMAFMWGHHPAFGRPLLDQHCVVDVGAKRIVVDSREYDPNGRLKPGAEGCWPMVAGRQGGQVDISRIPAPRTVGEDVAYLTDFEEGWYALTNTRKEVGFGMRWDHTVFPHLWFWQSYGRSYGYPWYGQTYNMALEPFTSFPGHGLEEVIRQGRERDLEGGETLETTLLAVAYAGVERVRRIDQEGQVEGQS